MGRTGLAYDLPSPSSTRVKLQARLELMGRSQRQHPCFPSDNMPRMVEALPFPATVPSQQWTRYQFQSRLRWRAGREHHRPFQATDDVRMQNFSGQSDRRISLPSLFKSLAPENRCLEKCWPGKPRTHGWLKTIERASHLSKCFVQLHQCSDLSCSGHTTSRSCSHHFVSDWADNNVTG